MQAQPRAVTVLPTQPSSLQLTQPDMQLQNFPSPENVSALRGDAICLLKISGNMAAVLLNRMRGQSVPGFCSQKQDDTLAFSIHAQSVRAHVRCMRML